MLRERPDLESVDSLPQDKISTERTLPLSTRRLYLSSGDKLLRKSYTIPVTGKDS